MAEKQLGSSPAFSADIATKGYVDAAVSGAGGSAGSNTYSTSVGNGSSTSIAVVHGLGTTDVVVSVYVVATGEEVECDVATTDDDTVTLTFATAPATDSLRCVVIGTALGLGLTPADVFNSLFTDNGDGTWTVEP